MNKERGNIHHIKRGNTFKTKMTIEITFTFTYSAVKTHFEALLSLFTECYLNFIII